MYFISWLACILDIVSVLTVVSKENVTFSTVLKLKQSEKRHLVGLVGMPEYPSGLCVHPVGAAGAAVAYRWEKLFLDDIFTIRLLPAGANFLP